MTHSSNLSAARCFRSWASNTMSSWSRACRVVLTRRPNIAVPSETQPLWRRVVEATRGCLRSRSGYWVLLLEWRSVGCAERRLNKDINGQGIMTAVVRQDRGGLPGPDQVILRNQRDITKILSSTQSTEKGVNLQLQRQKIGWGSRRQNKTGNASQLNMYLFFSNSCCLIKPCLLVHCRCSLFY